MAGNQCFSPIRLSPGELETLLMSLDRESGERLHNSKRRSRRWNIHGKKVILTTVGEAGSNMHFSSYARNLSSGGLSLLHGGFMHKGAVCYVTLRGIDGKARTLHMQVVRCAHLHKNLHEVGLKFDATIDPREFIDFGDAHVFTVESVEVSELKGTLLVVEDDRSYQALVKSYFNGSNLDLQFADCAEAAMAMIAENPDMAFVDLHLPDKDGLTLVGEIRGVFYEGPIVMLTADTTPGLRKRALKAGANEMLIKPCPPQELHRAAAEYLLAGARDPNVAGTFESARPENVTPEMQEMFLESTQKHATELAKAIEDVALEPAKEAVRLLRATADGYGFTRLAELSRDALKSLDASMSVEESAKDLQRLVAWCKKVQARARPG